MAIGAPLRPATDTIDDSVIGFGRCKRSGRDDGDVDTGRAVAGGRPGSDPAARRRTRSRRYPRGGRAPRPMRERPCPSPGGCRSAASRSRGAAPRAVPPWRPSPRRGRAGPRRARPAGSPKTRMWSAMAPARTTVTSGRRDAAAAATTAASSPRPRRSSEDGGLPAPTRIAATSGSSSTFVIVSGSVVSVLAAVVSQPDRDAVATSVRERSLGGRDDREPPRRVTRHFEPRQVVDGRGRRSRARRELGVDPDRSFGEDRRERGGICAGRQHE